MQFSLCPQAGAKLGCLLTTLMGNTLEPVAGPVVAKAAPTAEPKKRGWLPLLTILFLISYGIMTMLIVEQGQTIESQRVLIRELFRDSRELSASKVKAQQQDQYQNQNKDKNLTQAQRSAQTAITGAPTQAPSIATPSTQIPSAQAPATQTPSSQAVPQHRAQVQNGKNTRQFQMPSRPASDLADDRRALISI
jgi:hypothetical protein